MKKLFLSMGLLLLSQQSLAVTTVAGIDFLNIADDVVASVGTYNTNYTAPGATAVDSVADGNGATWVFSNDTTATIDLGFSSGAPFDVSAVDLAILFVGDAGHTGSVTLLGGSLDGQPLAFGLLPGEGYTNFNSQTPLPNEDPLLYGIFAANIDLSGLGGGTFTGLRLDISDASAVPSLIGTVASVTPVPVPAAVWLFGSGLIGLVGIARRRR